MARCATPSLVSSGSARLARGERTPSDRERQPDGVQRARAVAGGQADDHRQRHAARRDRRDDAHRADRERAVERAERDRAADAGGDRQQRRVG